VTGPDESGRDQRLVDRHPAISCCWADNSQLSKARFVSSVLYRAIFTFIHLVHPNFWILSLIYSSVAVCLNHTDLFFCEQFANYFRYSWFWCSWAIYRLQLAMNTATVLPTGHNYTLADLHLNNVWFSPDGTAGNCGVHINFVWQSFMISAGYFRQFYD
jgi:hypothetical protein